MSVDTEEPELEEEDGLAGPATARDEELRFEASLRPESLGDYVGQDAIRETLGIAMRAASARGDVLDHVLLCGPPGLGKTSLAEIIAREMGVKCRKTQGPAVERGGDLAAVLSDLEAGDVLAGTKGGDNPFLVPL